MKKSKISEWIVPLAQEKVFDLHVASYATFFLTLKLPSCKEKLLKANKKLNMGIKKVYLQPCG